MNRGEVNDTPSHIHILGNNVISNSSDNNHAYISSSWNGFVSHCHLRIIEILGLDNNIESNIIATKLLIQGRQSLSDGQTDIAPNIYRQQMTSDQSELFGILKDYFDRQWHTTTADWFQIFVREQKRISPKIYDQLLTSTANYGWKFFPDNFYLPFTIRLLFDCQDRTTPSFTEIWNVLINQGLQGIKEYQDYIASKVNEELFEHDRNPLYLALGSYFRQTLFNLFKEENLNIHRPDLIEHVLQCVINNGWRKGLYDPRIRDEISPNKWKKLLDSLPSISNSSPVTHPIITTTTTTNPLSARPSSSTETSTNILSVEPTAQENKSEMKSMITTLVQASSSPIIPSSPRKVPNTYLISDESRDDIGLRVCQDDESSITTPNIIVETRDDEESTKEHEIISMFSNKKTKLQLSDLVQAGELIYMDENLYQDIGKITEDYQFNRQFSLFIEACFTPLIYLLKRHQNFHYFMIIFFLIYSKMPSSLTTLNLSLRMFVDLLLLRSDFSLSRKILLLLSQHNPVPFLQPILRFVSDIIHVWNYSIPTVLSFGIGPCQGKSLLLNQIFSSSFEQSMASIYFENTIDIDFGYYLLPRRSTNIADAHGSMTNSLLEQIHQLFDGFLIHIQYSYLRDHLSLIRNLLNLVNSTQKYQLLIIRDVSNEHQDECRKLLAKEFPDNQAFLLPNVLNRNKKENKYSIIALRDQIFDQSSKISLNHSPEMTKNVLLHLINSQYKEHFIQMSNNNIQPLQTHLSQLVNNPTLVSNYFPEYLVFVQLCAFKLKLARLNFYGSDNDAMVYELRHRIFQLENVSQTYRGSCSIIYQLFFEMLTTPHSLTCLDILTIELRRQQRAQLVSTGYMSRELPIERNLSLELLWRNAIVCSQYQSENDQKVLQEKYYQYIQVGYPFEIVDGDNFHFQYSFLSKALISLRNRRTLVISIIGPRNSGKSTLLNYMFGTSFDVRCTRGIYGSLIKSNRTDFDSILLIDTEGLLSVERTDSEYDRRIVLFCLAVSHVVLVNMIGEVNVTLQEMLKLCAESLDKMSGTGIPRPIVHLILNQKFDLTIVNHQATMEKIIHVLKREGLEKSIDIRRETFHTLPSAFIKEGQTLTPFDSELPSVIKVDQEFIQCVRRLLGKVLNSIQSTDMCDPLQWLSSSMTIFDTLQKSADLTYYRDINERRIDNEVREHIRNTLLNIFSTNYRDELILQTSNKNEDEIQRLFLGIQKQIEERTEQDLENLLQLFKVSDQIRTRNKQFLRVQIIEMFNILRISIVESNRRRQVSTIIHHAEAQLRQFIENIIRSGRLMLRENAEQEFERMYQNMIEVIRDEFNPEQRFIQAMKYIYTNYHIYEKECLFEFASIDIPSSLFTDRTSMNNLEEVFDSYFTNLAYQKPVIIANHFNPTGTLIYSFDIINSLIYLNRNLLEQEFRTFVNQSSRQVGNNKWQDTDQERSTYPVTNVSSSSGCHQSNGHPILTSTDQFQMAVRNAMQNQCQVEVYGTRVDERNLYLGLSGIIREVIRRIIQTMQGVNSGQVQQIRIELIQKTVGLVNSLIIDIKNELNPFCLELSTDLKSILHRLAMIILTKYYYDEQINYFNQILADFERKKSNLREYLITNVCSNSSRDRNYAFNLAQQFKDYLIQLSSNDGQRIITEDSKQYQCLNRKWIQDRIDGQLEVNHDVTWYFDYISNPTKISEQFFTELWINVKKAIDQNLVERKAFYMKIITEFFQCIEAMLNNVRHLGASNEWIDEIFQAEGENLSNTIEALSDKNQCMVVVLYQYMAEQRIPSSLTVNRTVYHIRRHALIAFQSLVEQQRPSDELAQRIKEIYSAFQNISIDNSIAFLEVLLDEREKILHDFNLIPYDFDRIDRQDTYARLLDKVRGCPDLCPCCRRPCDFDHTQIQSNPGSLYNEHRCQSGHSLRAMNGYKFEMTNEPSLLMCEQIKDDQILVIGPTHYRWSDFKRYHPDWIFESTSLNDHELNRLHGKFLTVWRQIGEELCEKYHMKYVRYNTSLNIAHESFHYILLLNGSKSMQGPRWQDLLNAVQEFLRRRSALNTFDRISIIVFSSSATIVYSGEDIQHIYVNNIRYPGGETSFRNAFECVDRCITYSRRHAVINSIHNKFALVFMSDGEDEYPDRQLKHLLNEHGSVIKRFWTLALGNNQASSMKILEKINATMNGSFIKLATSVDLIAAYAKVASSIQ